MWRSMHLTIERRNSNHVWIRIQSHCDNQFGFSKICLVRTHTPKSPHVDINLLQSRVHYSFSFSMCHFSLCFSNEFNEKFESQFNQAFCTLQRYKWKTNTQLLLMIGYQIYRNIFNFREKSIFTEWQKRTSMGRHMQHVYGESLWSSYSM